MREPYESARLTAVLCPAEISRIYNADAFSLTISFKRFSSSKCDVFNASSSSSNTFSVFSSNTLARKIINALYSFGCLYFRDSRVSNVKSPAFCKISLENANLSCASVSTQPISDVKRLIYGAYSARSGLISKYRSI